MPACKPWCPLVKNQLKKIATEAPWILKKEFPPSDKPIIDKRIYEPPDIKPDIKPDIRPDIKPDIERVIEYEYDPEKVAELREFYELEPEIKKEDVIEIPKIKKEPDIIKEYPPEVEEIKKEPDIIKEYPPEVVEIKKEYPPEVPEIKKEYPPEVPEIIKEYPPKVPEIVKEYPPEVAEIKKEYPPEVPEIKKEYPPEVPEIRKEYPPEIPDIRKEYPPKVPEIIKEYPPKVPEIIKEYPPEVPEIIKEYPPEVPKIHIESATQWDVDEEKIKKMKKIKRVDKEEPVIFPEECDPFCPRRISRKNRIRKLEERQSIIDSYLLNKGTSYFDDICTCSLSCVIRALKNDSFIRSTLTSLALFAVGLKLCSELDAWYLPIRFS